MKKYCFIWALMTISTGTFGQDIPPLPGRIEPGLKDTSYFICSVTGVNEDSMASMLGHGTKNLWTQAVKGGKFELVSPTSVRVMAPDADAAKKDIYDFYQKFAAAAYVRSPRYDKGKKDIGYVVRTCDPDASHATNVKLAVAPLDKYKSIDTDIDHIINFLTLLRSPLSDEDLVNLTDHTVLPNDVFEKKAAINKRASVAKDLMGRSAAANRIKISGKIQLGAFSFETNSFQIVNLKKSVEEYSYVIKGRNFSLVTLPIYEVEVQTSFLQYKPKTIEEAKLIERARSAASLGRLPLTSYIQVTAAEMRPGQQPAVKGSLAAIDVYDEKGTLLFRMAPN